MKTSAEFAQQQLDRARQIASKRKVLTPEHLGQVVTLTIQGNGNMLSSRPAMIYNTNATTLDRALVAKKQLGTAQFMGDIEDLDEAGVQAHVNTILNGTQLSFTVPLNQSIVFSNRDLVTALVEEYSTPARPATDTQPERAASKGVGLNNVKPVKAVAIAPSNVFSNWDDEPALLDENAVAAEPAAISEDPFAAENVEPAATTKASK